MKHKNISFPRLHPETFLFSALALFIFILVGFIIAYTTLLSQQARSRIVCSQETRMCPNGSVVSRSGPTCQFTSCPKDALPNYPGITEEPFKAPLSATITATPEPGEKKIDPINKKGILCTQEVRLCSDGSFVGKTGLNCEFAPCPDDLEPDTDR